MLYNITSFLGYLLTCTPFLLYICINKQLKGDTIMYAQFIGTMKPTKAQLDTLQNTLTNDPSMKWDGKIGYYSNGTISITITWDFDETNEEFSFNILPNGTRE